MTFTLAEADEYCAPFHVDRRLQSGDSALKVISDYIEYHRNSAHFELGGSTGAKYSTGRLLMKESVLQLLLVLLRDKHDYRIAACTLDTYIVLKPKVDSIPVKYQGKDYFSSSTLNHIQEHDLEDSSLHVSIKDNLRTGMVLIHCSKSDNENPEVALFNLL